MFFRIWCSWRGNNLLLVLVIVTRLALIAMFGRFAKKIALALALSTSKVDF